MIGWFKMKATFATNGKVGRAGPDGALVYLAILCQHVNHGSGGLLPEAKCEPDALKFEAGALVGRWTAKRISTAFARCVESGLLQVEHGVVRVTGYDEDAMPACVRCRKPNNDHRFATCVLCRTTRNADDVSRQGATSSDSVATLHTGPDRTGPKGRDGTGPSERPSHPSESTGNGTSALSVPLGGRAELRSVREPEGGEGRDREPSSDAGGERALWDFLRLVRYREQSPHRDHELTQKARELVELRCTVPDLLRVFQRIARRKGVRDPHAVFASLLDNPNELLKEVAKAA